TGVQTCALPISVGADLLGGAQPVHAGHLDVQHGHVRPVLQHRVQHLVAPAHLGDDLDAVLQVEQRGERAADEVLVVGQQHARRHAGTSTLSTYPPAGVAAAECVPPAPRTRWASPPSTSGASSPTGPVTPSLVISRIPSLMVIEQCSALLCLSTLVAPSRTTVASRVRVSGDRPSASQSTVQRTSAASSTARTLASTSSKSSAR